MWHRGSNASKPHAIPTDRIIQSEDVILIDMGCKYNGYCSDMSRTIFVDKVPNNIKLAYDMVLENQNIVLNELCEGKLIKDIALTVEKNFSLKRYNVLHACGHGIGLECHEVPFIGTKNMNTIKENMVLAIEPGAYMTGNYGVRIEDTVLVKKNNCIELTKSEKNYIVI